MLIFLNIVGYAQSGMQLYWHILENLQLVSNRVDNFEAIYCTMCLICLEVGQDEVIIELARLALDIQVSHLCLSILYALRLIVNSPEG